MTLASLPELPAFALQVLADFASRLAQLGVEVPERRYRTPASMIPWDGEQFTVSLMGIDQGRPGAAQAQSVVPQAAIFYASLALNLIRAVPILNVEAFAEQEIPTAEDLDGSGEQLLGDAAALVLAATEFHQSYVLADPGVDLVIGPLQPVGPEGGLAGSRMLLSFSLS